MTAFSQWRIIAMQPIRDAYRGVLHGDVTETVFPKPRHRRAPSPELPKTIVSTRTKTRLKLSRIRYKESMYDIVWAN